MSDSGRLVTGQDRGALWLILRDGGQADMAAERSHRAAARLAGLAAQGFLAPDGRLTSAGRRIAEQVEAAEELLPLEDLYV